MRLPWVITRRVLIVLAFVAVLLRPGFGEREAVAEVADVEVMVVVDRTRSMAALDHDGDQPRLHGAQTDLQTLVEALPATRFSLLTWGTDARLELPFTTDHGAFLNAVDTILLEDPYDSSGSDVSAPVRELVVALKQAEEQYPDRTRMLVYVSDGENTSGGEPESFERVAKYLDGGLVLGYGTPEGAPMPLADDLSDAEGVIQVDGGDAISRADPDALRTVAEQTGTSYLARPGGGDLAGLAEEFRGDLVSQPDDSLPAEHDLTWVAGLALLALLLWELHGHWRALWDTPRALGVRRREEVG